MSLFSASFQFIIQQDFEKKKHYRNIILVEKDYPVINLLNNLHEIDQKVTSL